MRGALPAERRHLAYDSCDSVEVKGGKKRAAPGQKEQLGPKPGKMSKGGSEGKDDCDEEKDRGC